MGILSFIPAGGHRLAHFRDRANVLPLLLRQAFLSAAPAVQRARGLLLSRGQSDRMPQPRCPRLDRPRAPRQPPVAAEACHRGPARRFIRRPTRAAEARRAELRAHLAARDCVRLDCPQPAEVCDGENQARRVRHPYGAAGPEKSFRCENI